MELLERFSQGDEGAFEALFRQHQSEVFGWIVRIVRDRGIAEDLTVEAFWRMHRSHARFDPARSFGAWARRIATNLALDHLRKIRREVPLVSDPADAAQANPGVQREAREQIAAAFRELSPKLRAVATLSLVEDVPHREIAEALGISEAAVRVRLFRATRILREQLKERGSSDGRN
jgi:RNA polymerase sigma-70 factor (ECF subfamily)